MASQWIRWNNTTHIFEYSTDNGSSFGPLPLNASILTEGNIPIGRLPANIALKDANNIFTSGMPIEIDAATPIVFRSKETGQPVDQKQWQLYGTAGTLILAPLSDAGGSQATAFQFNRTGILYANAGVDAGPGVVTDAKIRTRKNGNSIEFGHTNTAGYGGALGANAATGNPFLAFNCEHGTNPDTFRTRGVVGSLLRSDNAGGMIFFRVTGASADNQTPVQLFSIDSGGSIATAGNCTVAAGLSVQGNIAAQGNVSAAIITANNYMNSVAGYFEAGRGTQLGYWVNVPFNAANFGAGAGAWTPTAGQVGAYKYSIIGKTMFFTVAVGPSNISAVTAWVSVALPAGFSLATIFNFNATIYNGAWQSAFVQMSGNTFQIFGTVGAGNWAAGPNAYIHLNVTLGIA